MYSSSAPIFPEAAAPSGPRFGDFNAKPKGFGSWNGENTARSQSPRAPIDPRKPLNLNIEPSIREGSLPSYCRFRSSDAFFSLEGIAESHTRSASQPWSPPVTNPYFAYPPTSSHPISHDGIDHLRQRLTQHQTNQVPASFDQYYKPTRPSPVPTMNSYASAQHFTDLWKKDSRSLKSSPSRWHACMMRSINTAIVMSITWVVFCPEHCLFVSSTSR